MVYRTAQTAACPRCSDTLEPAATGVRPCSGCGGVWLQSSVAEKLLAEPELGPWFSYWWVRALTCPTCGKSTRTMGLLDMLVDHCAQHGLWLDAGELDRLLDVSGIGGEVGELLRKVTRRQSAGPSRKSDEFPAPAPPPEATPARAPRDPSVPVVPAGMRAVGPYLIVERAAGLLAWIREVFGAEVRGRSWAQDGSLRYACIDVAGETIEIGGVGAGLPPRPGGVRVHVEDVDATYATAITAGARSLAPPTARPYGDREAVVEDDWGNVWIIATQIEAVGDERRGDRPGDPRVSG